ncbi:protein SUR7 [Kluyveromyces marxianus]|uniref:Protein SUR7 n=2 Tax=Kluyveromyces marxianus TaxID=4911 RepID=W0T3S2_KLUMD|nr:protein SUR7 [Kluyveromyces marxianus DMKU3-1042]QGN13768.1 protein SUR7 [Kluyveromyces marxianus]BAO38050.1 protein SUR7 [Kluyveromyces marxianus DMKU3-1042]BAP69622.1 protein SUR7 [Kluyveromyces marxianus]
MLGDDIEDRELGLGGPRRGQKSRMLVVKASKSLVRFISILFLAGSTLLLLFIVMSGSINHAPINKFYWLQADTSNISSAPALSRWTFWGVCGVSGGKNVNCTDLGPAYPLSPVDNFHTKVGMPHDFVANRSTYYYLTRFSFVFLLLALVFVGLAMLFYLMSWVSGAFQGTIFVLIGLGTLLNITGSACQTAAVAMAKNKFKDDHFKAKIGVKMMAFAWTTVALDICLFFLLGSFFLKRVYNAHREFVELQKYKEQTAAVGYDQQGLDQGIGGMGPVNTMGPIAGDTVEDPKPEPPHQSGIKFFKIRRTHKSDDESM